MLPRPGVRAGGGWRVQGSPHRQLSPVECSLSLNFLFKKKKLRVYLAVSGLRCSAQGFSLVVACGLQSTWAR